MKSGVVAHTYSPQLVPRLQDCCEFDAHGEILSQNKPAKDSSRLPYYSVQIHEVLGPTPSTGEKIFKMKQQSWWTPVT